MEDLKAMLDSKFKASPIANMGSDNFERLMPLVLYLEGGYSNNRNDPGGRTMYGITNRTYSTYKIANKERVKDWPDSVNDISLEIARQIYFEEYWINPEICTLPLEMAKHCFIAGINIGPSRAIAMVQNQLGVVPDGIIGDKTFTAAWMDEYPGNTVVAFCRDLLEYYEGLSHAKYFINGWRNRVFHTLRYNV